MLRFYIFVLYKTDNSCPYSHPYAFMWGMYCCEDKKEGHGKTAELGCNGGDLDYDSTCCEGDKQIMCTKDGGCKHRKRNEKFDL